MLPNIILDNIQDYDFYPMELTVEGRRWRGWAYANVHGNDVLLKLDYLDPNLNFRVNIKEELKKHLKLHKVNNHLHTRCVIVNDGLWINDSVDFDRSILEGLDNKKMVELGFSKVFAV